MSITSRRIYGDERKGTEFRVLVDRLWPRGIAKADADIDAWLKGLSPSNDLRSWFHDDPENRYDEFASRLEEELAEAEPDLSELEGQKNIVLLTAAKDPDQSHVPTIMAYLNDRLASSST